MDKEMPTEVKASVEKAQATLRKSVIKGLQSATKDLDNASKRLNDAIQARQKHRSQWLQHLEESVQLWQTQLNSYKKRQQELQEEAKQAQKDVHAARQAINDQNAQAGATGKGKATPAPLATEDVVLDLTDDAEAEEESMKKKLQFLLQRSAHAAGVESGSGSQRLDSSGAAMEDISSGEELMNSKPKRPRSVEPGS